MLPPANELLVLIEEEGLTHREAADRYGVSREAVTNRLRALQGPAGRLRHNSLLPWRVKKDHAQHYAARMLRLEGRLRAGLEIGDREAKKLASWRESLRRDESVILYLPEHPDRTCPTCGGEGGFHPMRRDDAFEKYGPPHGHFDSELIFVTQRQGQEATERLGGRVPTHV